MDIPENGIDTTPAVLLRYVQQQRMKTLLCDDVIDDSKMAVLSSISKTALDQTRIMVESNSVKAQREIAGVIAKLVSLTPSNPFMVKDAAPVADIDKYRCNDLPDVTLVDGETSREISTLTYNDFVDVKAENLTDGTNES
jgi:hypothetical protein